MTEKMTADERVAAARIGRFNEHVAIDAVWCADAIAIAEAHAAAAVAEVAKERDEALERVRTLESRIRSAARLKGPVSAESLYGEQLMRERAEAERDLAKARVAALEALLREWCDANDGGDNWSLANAYRRARAALAPQAPPARKEGE